MMHSGYTDWVTVLHGHAWMRAGSGSHVGVMWEGSGSHVGGREEEYVCTVQAKEVMVALST